LPATVFTLNRQDWDFGFKKASAQRRKELEDNYLRSWELGEDTYLFSYMEKLIRSLFESLPEYKHKKEVVFGNRYLSPIEILNICLNIYKDRSTDKDLSIKMVKLATEFESYYNDRKIIQHGFWCASGPTVQKAMGNGNAWHFSKIQELQELNKNGWKWVQQFEILTGINFKTITTGDRFVEIIKLNGVEYFKKYIFYLGLFVREFSQLEYNIKICAMPLAEGNDVNFYHAYAKKSVDYLVERFKGHCLNEMNHNFKGLNRKRSRIIHDCYKLKESFDEIMDARKLINKLFIDSLNLHFFITNDKQLVNDIHQGYF